ncbi:DUF1330 domain-containing protein [Microlunatus ginsengisoli]|uniref:DUF1330 domain-containing protein n=1 Tax=Microlunatus ginsengisoli TaxID=363863 RepID=A0ABP6ZBT7_9ACTN
MLEPPTYAVALLQDLHFGADLIEYLRQIDATLDPYGGRFLVHQPGPTLVEGELSGRTALIVIAFPDRRSATQWYDSPAYQEILPLRTGNSRAFALLADGVPEHYRAAEGLAEMLARRPVT